VAALVALMQRVKLPQCHHCPCAASAMHVARQRRTPVVQGTLLDGRRACACVTPQGRLRGKAVSASSYASRKYILLLTEHMNIARLLDVARSLICLRLCSDALEHRCLVALTASAPASARLAGDAAGAAACSAWHCRTSHTLVALHRAVPCCSIPQSCNLQAYRVVLPCARYL